MQRISPFLESGGAIALVEGFRWSTAKAQSVPTFNKTNDGPHCLIIIIIIIIIIVSAPAAWIFAQDHVW